MRQYPLGIDTDQQRIDFLWQQLENAIAHLRTKDATEVATVQRMEKLYAAQIKDLEARIKKLMEEKRKREGGVRSSLQVAMDRAMRRKPN